MKNDKELLEQYQVSLQTFEPDQWYGRGFYDAETRTIYLNSSLSYKERYQVLLHELGHREHLPCNYQANREKCELQANRNMIHHLLEAELRELDDVSNFNYVRFMETYKLKTIADEAMVKEEFYRLVG
jgi:Zn-dependent peptidase ImmA (M78 family)